MQWDFETSISSGDRPSFFILRLYVLHHEIVITMVGFSTNYNPQMLTGTAAFLNIYITQNYSMTMLLVEL